jgi:sugar (pentulose or hexulose) kinase
MPSGADRIAADPRPTRAQLAPTDLVIGLDSSTTSTKAIAWDRDGQAAAAGNAPVPLSRPEPGAFEQEPEAWWASACAALQRLTRQVDPTRIGALAISNQRETVGFLDERGQSVRPALLWLDERCQPDVAQLGQALGVERLRRTTGKSPNPTPALYSMHWLRRKERARYDATAHFVDVHGYLVMRLCGARATSWASADPHGLFDLERKRYAPEIMGWMGLTEARLFPAHPPGAVLGEVSAAAAAATGLRPGTLVAAGGGDGQAAGLGCAVLEESRAYLNLGTAAVSGVQGRLCRTDAAFRTEISLTGDGYVFETILRTGAFLTDWLVQDVLGFDPRNDSTCYDRLEAEAASVPPGSDGLLLLPYWGGAMDPYWDEHARGLILGFGPDHTRAHLYRAVIEGIALHMAGGYAAIERATGVPIQEVVAIGGGARSALWRQVVADATGREVVASHTVEASALGAGMVAATALGWYPDAATAARAMQGGVQSRSHPDPARHARYAELLGVFQDAYPAIQATMGKLAAFRAGDAA